VIIPSGFERVHAPRTAMLVRSDSREWLVPLLLSAARGEVAADAVLALSAGRGGAAVLQVLGDEVVLRPYHRGGLPARLLRDVYLGWNPRPLRELCALERLRRRGAPVVEPLGACVRWLVPGCYRGWIVTRYVQEARTVWDWTANGPTGAGRAAVWRQVGTAIRELHQAGGRHPDLNLHNILLNPAAAAGRIVFVDFDQPRLSAIFHNAAADLARLRRSARKLDPEGARIMAGDLDQLLAGYRGVETLAVPSCRAVPTRGDRVSAARILIVLHGAIGDITRALPLVNRLRRGYPRARIVWAIEPAAAPLLLHHPAVDEVLVFDRPRGVPAFLRFLRQVRALHPDLVLDLQRHLKSGIVSRASGAPVRLGFHRRNAREGNWLFNTHRLDPMPHLSSKLEQFLRFADWLGVEEAPITFGLRLTEAEERRVDALLTGVASPFVVAFVGASWESRVWFPDRTAAVADALAARGLGVVLVGGPGDVQFAESVAEAARTPLLNLTGRIDLRDLIGIFGRARAAFGPDTGPMHIAAAVGTPVISLWGATSPARSAPWGNEARVIAGTAPCVPCYRRRCPIGRVCMQSINVEAVVAKVIAALG
jgi:ADP-heptose:LPS heptosyltransferase/tRNA A-37 threonylcarbamoyl transferase component Bud32